MNLPSSSDAEHMPNEPEISPVIERQIAGLIDLTRTMTEAGDLHTALHGALQPIAETSGWCYGEVWLPDDQQEMLHSVATWHEDDETLVEFAATSGALRFTPGTGLLGRVWQSQRSEWIADFNTVASLALQPERVVKAGLRSGLFLPIIVHERVLALLVFFGREVRPKNEPLLRLITLVAAQIGAAIHRFEVQEALRARDASERKQQEAALRALSITERQQVELALRAAEDELRRTNDELERRVAERTDALEQANALLQRESAERAEAEQQLRASEERFRQITEHISEVFYIFDLATQKVLYVSPSYERIWGRSRESLYADPASFVEAVHADDRSRVIESLQRQAQGQATKEVYRLLMPDGSLRWISDRSFLVYSQQGDLYRVVGLAEDVTEQRQVNETLERRVAKRTAALSEANAELERAARLKDEFLANMSHELRTPLNTILTLTEAVTEGVYGPLNDRQQYALDAVSESGQHLLALINDILDLTKIESGKVELAIESLDVEEICTASLRMVRQLAHAKRLQISSSIDPLVDLVAADPRRLKQILVNLLSNAVKFTPEGGRVSLAVHGDREAEVVHFSVEDTGIGIEAEDIPRLFKPFVQLDSRLSRRHEGTGLGLALVAHLTELHNGGIRMHSTPGKGSCFTVTLPWRAPAVSEVVPIAAPRKVAGPGSHEQPTVLLAEDNELVIHTTLDYLTAYGYRVQIARNGVEAVELARELLPDVILMDIHMPVMDGFEAMRQIRADATAGATPIIALTALAMVGDRERCLGAGADDYLSKPVKFSQLIERIEILRHK